MVPKKKIDEILDGYDPSKITIATLCSHSSLQIFHGARKMGFRTLGLAVKDNEKVYDAFPLAKPDEFLKYASYDDMRERAGELIDRNVILIPHGSFVEYMGARKFEDFDVPSYGNRAVLQWESDRDKQRQWITSAGAPMPRLITDAREIKEPVMVKYHGAKGGRGFFIAKDYPDFKMGIDNTQPYTIQEYCLGTRYYLHFFYDPLKKDGYRVAQGGSLELLSMDRRDESNIDEMYKLGSIEDAKRHGLYPSFVVTGNTPVVLRESLLPKAFEMAEEIVNRSYELFGGMWGPFCLETVVNDKLEFRIFEISTRIVAGTNPFISGSPYADLIYPGLSTGGRMAMEIRDAIRSHQLKTIIS
ncbi:MAG: formate--phosphoribosylaminoimidazolecarboxamide ligase [Candidatus Methanomethylophilus sp.]|nr:formate--phosphoribosylaminoimidazolecarboxamide ligase [Methanomethylophilus sp.]MDD4221676.1 formate--phosphoribosylaminoimidazolecarboxamide ligase [Methanomethylophilus sp.]MDD4668474.1 formate--phosphoribosylaminoimidazolecarboxamide ligase [Methanomethylophilus sp.]